MKGIGELFSTLASFLSTQGPSCCVLFRAALCHAVPMRPRALCLAVWPATRVSGSSRRFLFCAALSGAVLCALSRPTASRRHDSLNCTVRTQVIKRHCYFEASLFNAAFHLFVPSFCSGRPASSGPVHRPQPRPSPTPHSGRMGATAHVNGGCTLVGVRCAATTIRREMLGAGATHTVQHGIGLIIHSVPERRS